MFSTAQIISQQSLKSVGSEIKNIYSIRNSNSWPFHLMKPVFLYQLFYCLRFIWLITERISDLSLYVVSSISFQTFFVQAFKIVIDSWKLTMLLLYILWDDWPIFMISGSNEQLHQELEYILLKPDYHSWWISKIQSDTLEE